MSVCAPLLQLGDMWSLPVPHSDPVYLTLYTSIPNLCSCVCKSVRVSVRMSGCVAIDIDPTQNDPVVTTLPFLLQVAGLYSPVWGEITSLDSGNIDDTLSELKFAYVCLCVILSQV